MKHPISTFPRFMYLNAYAFLLLLVGIGILLFPGYHISWWLEGFQLTCALFCWRVSARIFYTWKDKKRKYDLLMQRNADQWRPDTFAEYMQAPCGRLLVAVVLKDMHCPERFKELDKLRQPFMVRVRKTCKPERKRKVVYINPNL